MDRRDHIVDIIVQCAMMIHGRRDYFEGKSFNEIGKYIRNQLNECNYYCKPMGSLHVKMDESAW